MTIEGPDWSHVYQPECRPNDARECGADMGGGVTCARPLTRYEDPTSWFCGWMHGWILDERSQLDALHGTGEPLRRRVGMTIRLEPQ